MSRRKKQAEGSESSVNAPTEAEKKAKRQHLASVRSKRFVALSNRMIAQFSKAGENGMVDATKIATAAMVASWQLSDDHRDMVQLGKLAAWMTKNMADSDYEYRATKAGVVPLKVMPDDLDWSLIRGHVHGVENMDVDETGKGDAEAA